MKLKAFTLIETVIVIALTGVLVFFCVYSYLVIKTHENVIGKRTDDAASVSLAAEKISQLTYRSTEIGWENPRIIFRMGKVLGKVEVEKDSLAVMNSNDVVLVKVKKNKFSIETIDLKGGIILIKGITAYLDGIEEPLVFEKKYASDISLNETITWKN